MEVSDMKDGKIVLECGATLTPRMMRTQFEAEVPNASLFDEHRPYARFSIGLNRIGGRAFYVDANFENDTLWMVGFVDKEIAEAGWLRSAEKVARSKAENEAWLINMVGKASGQYSWGKIEAGVDVKIGIPQIIVRYY